MSLGMGMGGRDGTGALAAAAAVAAASRGSCAGAIVVSFVLVSLAANRGSCSIPSGAVPAALGIKG